MVAGEGRPKRACADGIDYAGTDQVPGWTVRVSFFFSFAFLFFVWERNFKIFLAPSLSLRLGGFSFSFFFFFVVVAACCCLSLLFARSFIAHRGR